MKAVPNLEIEANRQVLVKKSHFEIVFDMVPGITYIIPSFDGNIHWDRFAGESVLDRRYNDFTA
jgi:hypothetical protein